MNTCCFHNEDISSAADDSANVSDSVLRVQSSLTLGQHRTFGATYLPNSRFPRFRVSARSIHFVFFAGFWQCVSCRPQESLLPQEFTGI
jgi:hypothetical protein